jgi:hypothetical protein
MREQRDLRLVSIVELYSVDDLGAYMLFWMRVACAGTSDVVGIMRRLGMTASQGPLLRAVLPASPAQAPSACVQRCRAE